jgi:hypothetical protein
MQCTNHLKQIGLAVHNFHDVLNGIPPATVSGTLNQPCRWNLATFWPLIYPYLEQTALYDQYANADFFGLGNQRRTGFNVYFNSHWWWNPDNLPGGLNADLRRQHASVSVLVCPSRRAPGRMADAGTDRQMASAADSERASGPVSDYAAVIYFETAVEGEPWWHMGTAEHRVAAAVGQKGPIRQALLMTAGDHNTWRPRDSFSWWRDGTSNQLVLGEKHIPRGLVDVCHSNRDPAIAGNRRVGVGDCSILNTGEWRTAPSFRVVRFISPHAIGGDFIPGIVTPDTMDYSDHTTGAFGSVHTGVCNFVLGDGSVRGISATINPILLGWLGCVNDGNAVSVP